MKRPSLISVIKPVLVCIFICALSVGLVAAQSHGRAVHKQSPPQKPPVVNEAPKEAPKEAAASTAPTEKATTDSTKQSPPNPAPQIKVPPVRITLGAPSNNRNTTRPPGIQISPQDAAKLKKIMELFNVGQNNRR
jgi:hypothetical protein